MPYQRGSRAKESKSTTKFLDIFKLNFSWFDICLVAVDLWLFARAPMSLFQPVSKCLLTFPLRNKDLEFSSLPFCWCHSPWRIFLITCCHIFMKATLKALSESSNRWFTLVLTCGFCLFSLKLWFSWFLVWQVIFNCYLDILIIMLWDSGS